MELTIGKHAGFCFGVRRAVQTAFDAAKTEVPCVTLGPLIHNPQASARWPRSTRLSPGRRSSSAPMA